MTMAILRERDPMALMAPLLGPCVGLRARRPLLAALTAPSAFTVSREPEWIVQAPEGMGFNVRALVVACKVREWAQADHTAFVKRTAESPAEWPP